MTHIPQKQSTSYTHPAAFNYEAHIKELNERFGRLVKQLGSNNKAKSVRYNFEVDFAYSLNELSRCPPYLQGKRFDHASGIVSSLIVQLKKLQDEKTV